jgi:3-phosphoshikimate 1-carboxyvinyltransferase
LTVTGGGPRSLRPGRVSSHGDHRIAMAMAVAGLAIDGETVIDGWEAVATSYPTFEEDLHACVS